VEDSIIVKQWLQSKRGAKVDIQVPRRGDKKQLVDIVTENARQGLEQLKIKQATPEALEIALAEIQRELRLPSLPSRIEGYDISNIQGTAAVGSMVVFENGRPSPSRYRRFKIKTVTGADDYAMLAEVLRRRFKHINRPNASTPDAWAALPDLVLIDGGKGQLNAALKMLSETGADSVLAAGLTKENEELFIPQRTKPIILPKRSPGLQLLQRLRDEAHRFAISYHLKTRKKESFASALDSVPGIGPKRRRSLLKQFGSVQAIRETSVDELASARGMSKSAAKKIKEYL
jgi:excinuclease ABC subunit C